MTSGIRFGRLGAVLTANALMIFLAPAVVTAHAEIDTTIPANTSTAVEPVTEISATYTESLAKDSRLKVTDVDGATVATGSVDPDNAKRMVATPKQALESGTFTVASTAIAKDGHVERERWTFTVEVPVTPAPTPVVTPPASSSPTAAPTPSSSPIPSASPAPSASGEGGSPTGSTGDVILPIIAALAIVGVGGALLLGRRGRPGSGA